VNLCVSLVHFMKVQTKKSARARLLTHVNEIPFQLFIILISNSISILDTPETRLKLGASLSGDHIKEGSDVYFDCVIDANPPVSKVDWRHNVSSTSSRHIPRFGLAMATAWDCKTFTIARANFILISRRFVRRPVKQMRS